MVKGAVPGHKGGWVVVKDAVKRTLPEGVPFPGSFKTAADEAAPAKEADAAEASEAPEAEVKNEGGEE